MAFLARAFGLKKEGKQTSPQEAIQKLRETEEMLQKKADFLETKVTKELTIAKQHGTKNPQSKRIALQALKRKKRYEKQLNQIDGTLSTIEFQREALENATTNTEVLSVMGDAAKALQTAHKNLDIDKVHDLMDNVAEQNELAEEISNTISNPIGFGNEVDEDDLLLELEEIEQEAINEKLLDIPTEHLDHLPAVPSGEISTPSKDEDEDLKELMQWAT